MKVKLCKNALFAVLIIFCFSKNFYVQASAGHIDELTIATFNLENFEDVSYKQSEYEENERIKNYYELDSVFENMDADIIALQEVRSPVNFKKFLKQSHPKYSTVFSSCGGSGKQFLGFAFNKSKFSKIDQFEIEELQLGDCTRALRPGFFLELRIRGKKGKSSKLGLLNIHLKAGNRDRDKVKRIQQHAEIKSFLKTKKINTVVLGDFNSTELYENPYDHNHPFRQLIKKANLAESFKLTDKTCSSYYMPRNRSSRSTEVNDLIPSLLDHILVNQNFKQTFKASDKKIYGHCYKHQCESIEESDVDNHYSQISDHCPIVKEYRFK